MNHIIDTPAICQHCALLEARVDELRKQLAGTRLALSVVKDALAAERAAR